MQPSLSHLENIDARFLEPDASLVVMCESTLVLSYFSLCRPTFIPALRLYPRFLLWVFGALPGFACVRLVGFRPFGPLALV